jgi:SSS family solute:Na+ symporter
MFWKKTTPSAGLAGALLTVPLAAILKFLPMWTDGAFPDYPFLDRMTIVFFLIVFIMVGISLAKPASEVETEIHAIEVDNAMFKVSSEFIVGSFIICGILVALYTVFW